MRARSLKWIQQAILAHNYVLTEHAYEEMSADNLDVLDVESAVMTGRITAVLTRDRRGARYVVEGHACDLSARVGVVVRMVPVEKLLVVTVYQIK